MENIAQFFFHIVPGGLFVLSFLYIFPNFLGDIKFKDLIFRNDGLTIIAFIILSLFFGLLFQGFTKILRDCVLHEKVFKEVINEDKESFDIAFTEMEERKLITSNKNKLKNNWKSLQRFFYLLHDILEAEGKAALIRFFTTRLAFWANMYFSSLILLPLSALFLSTSQEKLWGLVALSFISLLSACLFGKNLKNLYDVIQKTFVGAYKTKPSNSPNPRTVIFN